MIKITDNKEHLEIVSEVINSLLKILKERLGKNLVSVVLYGSYARGEMGPESDVDLLIIAEGLSNSSLDRQAFFTQILDEVMKSFQGITNQTVFSSFISAILKTPEEADRISRIYFDMIEEAKILYDKNDFFKGVLKKVRERLEKLGAKRIRIGKMWYWDLKPDYQPGEIFEI